MGMPGPARCETHPVHSKHGDECGAAGHLAESLFLALFVVDEHLSTWINMDKRMNSIYPTVKRNDWIALVFLTDDDTIPLWPLPHDAPSMGTVTL